MDYPVLFRSVADAARSIPGLAFVADFVDSDYGAMVWDAGAWEAARGTRELDIALLCIDLSIVPGIRFGSRDRSLVLALVLPDDDGGWARVIALLAIEKGEDDLAIPASGLSIADCYGLGDLGRTTDGPVR